MKMLPKRAMALMVLVLFAATAATAATAFAGQRKKAVFNPQVVVESANLTSQAMLMAKVRAIRGQRTFAKIAYAAPK